jgi:putative pyruvate formate lyase activating enzyme
MTTASYVALFERDLLRERVRSANDILRSCTLCPRLCRVNRFESPGTRCLTGALPVVSACHPHFGEEAPLVGRYGSGTIFFAGCNFGCVFCQNWTTSRLLDAAEVSIDDLARMMVGLQRARCHNINLVTPSHMVPHILAALEQAVPMGLTIPLVYNSSGYDRVETLRLLGRVVDIYMPDVKFMSAEAGARYAAASDYPDVARAAVLEMHRQVGDLVVDGDGVAVRGLLVRHLVMPGGVAGTRDVCRFLAREISRNTYVNLMDQYRPCGDASRYPEIARRITAAEFHEAARIAQDEGLERVQGV